MPYEVKLSQLPKGEKAFADAVQAHIVALHLFSGQNGTPRPTAHPVIEACLKRVQAEGKPDRYVPDYVVTDDSPPPPTLEQKKEMLHRFLILAENEAKYSILPQRKVRLANLRFNLAQNTPEDVRTPDQNEDIASLLEVKKKWEAIELIGAQAESDLADLTEDNIDSWQVPTFG